MKRAFLPAWSIPRLVAARSRHSAVQVLAVLACLAVFGMTAWQVELARSIATKEMTFKAALGDLFGKQQRGLAGEADVPLAAFAAVDKADALADWRANVLNAWIAASLLSAGLGIFGWLLAAQIKRAEVRLRIANMQLQRTAMQDALTGIGNRRLFDSVLLKEQRRAARTEQPLALLMLDVDHFKAFNDSYGHQAGDVCLQRIAGTIARLAQRPADLAARFGGEEFAILLPETDAAGAIAIAERAQTAIRQLRMAHSGGVDGIVTVSTGLAVTWPQPPDGTDTDLIQLADAALYAAKAQGRDRACLSPAQTLPAHPDAVAAWLTPQSGH